MALSALLSVAAAISGLLSLGACHAATKDEDAIPGGRWIWAAGLMLAAVALGYFSGRLA